MKIIQKLELIEGYICNRYWNVGVKLSCNKVFLGRLHLTQLDACLQYSLFDRFSSADSWWNYDC